MNSKYFIVVIYSIVTFSIYTPAQQLWNFNPSPSDYVLLRGDTSSTLLYQILDTDSLKYDGIYFAAAHLLSYYEGESVKNFVLNKLNHYSNTTDSLFTWNRFFTYQLLKGYLGDLGAIAGLDSVVQYSNDIQLKLNGIAWLTEIGEFNYFDTVKNAFQNQGNSDRGISLLGRYGTKQQYTSEAKGILSMVISDSVNHRKVLSAARSLSEFDLPLTIQLLEDRFSSSISNDRFSYFTDLDYFDPNGQPERSIYAIPLESDVYIRSNYFPPTGSTEMGLVSRRYLEPFWINFIKEWYNVETETLIKTSIRWYLEDFKPAIIDSLASTLDLLSNLINIADTIYYYNWLGDLEFNNELQSIIQSAKTNLQNGDSLACAVQIKSFQDSVDYVYKDSLNTDPRFVTLEGWKFLYWNAQYILDRLPEIPSTEGISTYSIFATHGVWLEQNSEVLSGNIGVNEIGLPPFMDSDVELSIGISTETPAGYTIKANRIKVKQNAAVNSNVYYNELDNNGTITGTLNTPLELPLFTALPEFRTSVPGIENIVVPQNGEYTLTPGTYGEIQVKKSGRLIFTGGEYHINNFNGGDNNQILFQSQSEIRIKDKFDSGQGSYIGPEDTTTVSADEIVFYVEGINGNNGNLGATPKAAKIGISNTVKANFYVPNGTLWLRQNSEVEGAFIGKDVDVGIGVKVKLNSAF